MRRQFAPVLAFALCLALPVSCLASGNDRVSFALPGTDGKQHRLKEWRGKTVLLNFWASWCAPCQAEIRDLVVDQAMYGATGFQVVGIGLDDEAKLRNVERSLGINYPVLIDNSPTHALMSRLGNSEGVVPYSVLISRTGKVIYRHAGVIDKTVFSEDILPLLQ